MSFLRSPSKVVGWALALLVVAGFPVTSWIYWPAVAETGVLPPESDTIIIPMIESIFLAVVIAPVVGLISWLSLRRTTPGINLMEWDRDRPILSGIISLCAFPPLLVGVAALWEEANAPPGWHGLWWLPYTAIVIRVRQRCVPPPCRSEAAANHQDRTRLPDFRATPQQHETARKTGRKDRLRPQSVCGGSHNSEASHWAEPTAPGRHSARIRAISRRHWTHRVEGSSSTPGPGIVQYARCWRGRAGCGGRLRRS